MYAVGACELANPATVPALRFQCVTPLFITRYARARVFCWVVDALSGLREGVMASGCPDGDGPMNFAPDIQSVSRRRRRGADFETR